MLRDFQARALQRIRWPEVLRIVNSPVRISTPRTIITAPPMPMMTGKWRLTTASALVIRSNASAISRNGIARPGRVEGEQQRAVRRRARDRRLGEDRAERDARAGRPGDREGGARDERSAAAGEAQQRLGVPLAVEHADERRRQEDQAHQR